MTTESTSHETTPANLGATRAGGRFQPGNPGGPGNPFGGRAATLRRMMFERVSNEDLAAILDRVVVMAKDGHWQAAKLLLAYMLGKPPKAVDPTDEPDTAPVSDAPGAAPDVEPSPNGIFSERPPVADAPGSPVQTGTQAPSTNGIFAPPRNRKERRALRKAQRVAQCQPKARPVGPSPGR